MASCNASNLLECNPSAQPLTKRQGPLDDNPLELVVARLDIGSPGIASADALLSTAEWQRAHRLADQRQRRRFIAARSLLRQLLGERLAIRPEAVELIYGKYGKPALSEHLTGLALNFNVSHSHDLAVFAFASGRRIGVDIERIRPLLTTELIASHFFSRCEQDEYQSLEPADKIEGFFNAWTRKEAFVKAHGDGLPPALDAFDISLRPQGQARICRVGMRDGDACGWTLYSFQPVPGFVGAMVVEGVPDESPSQLTLRFH